MIKRIAVIALAVATLFIGGAQSASAEEAGNITFTGSATLNNGLWYPTGPSVKTGFSFSSDNCVDNGASAKKPDANVIAGQGCSISAEGELEGWCGKSDGKGSGTVTNSNGKTYEYEFTYTSAGGELVIQGEVTNPDTGKSGPLAGVVTAAPTTGSCTNGTATGFTIAGEVEYVIPN